jgi:two-component system, response regulator PdtaR
MIALVISSDPPVWRAAPTASDANSSEPEENRPVKATQSWRVLVVEDEFFISLHMKELLETLGHEVIAIAVSADEAVKIAAMELPDVVLMDIRLVGPRDGIDAAEEIRRRFGIRSIFVTANTDSETRKRALATKPIAFLEKPLTEHRLRLGLSGLSSD